MVKLNKTCIACKEKYTYCPSCSRADAIKPAWHSEFCSSVCKDLWITATKYNMNKLSKSEAKSIISSLDLKPIDAYVACIQRDYAVIMAEEKKSRKTKKLEVVIETETIAEQPVEEVAPVEESASHEVVLQEN